MINNKSILFAFVLLIASSLFWSGNFFTGKIASLYDLTPFKLSFLRWSLAFLLLLPFTYKRIILDLNKYKKNLPYLIITSILGVTIFNSFTYLSLQTSMVINSSIMASITPLLIILFSWLIFKTQTYFMQFFGIVLSIIGVLLIISKANLNNLINLDFTIGDLWMLAAVFSWGLYSVLLKKIDSTLSQLATLEVMIFIGLIFIFPFYFFESLNNSFLPKDSNEILDIALLTNSYFPKKNITEGEFVDFKLKYLIKNNDKNLIKLYLIKNEKNIYNSKLIKFYINDYAEKADLENACKIFDHIKYFGDDYINKFQIYCLIDQKKREEAQLLLI